MDATFQYATPLRVKNAEECFFYHRMNIPGIGDVGDQWDLRHVVDAYLGNVDLHGKRVLDMGAAAGFLTFEMEKRGAEVVSFDMQDGSQWNIVPHVADAHRRDEIRSECERADMRLKRAYWLAHERLGSEAKVYYGDVYNLPLELGTFDVVFFGMILVHLRDPFQALYSASRLCRDTIIVSTGARRGLSWRRRARAGFVPTRTNGVNDVWWSLSNDCIASMLDVLGFQVERLVRSKPVCLAPVRHGVRRCTTVVSSRVAGAPCCAQDDAATPTRDAA